MNFVEKVKKNLKTFLTSVSNALRIFTVMPPQSLLSSNQRGTHLTIHVESLMGEEKGFSPCSQYNKCNTENTFEIDKIQSYF